MGHAAVGGRRSPWSDRVLTEGEAYVRLGEESAGLVADVVIRRALVHRAAGEPLSAVADVQQAVVTAINGGRQVGDDHAIPVARVLGLAAEVQPFIGGDPGGRVGWHSRTTQYRLRDMQKTSPPPLLPLLRSRLQAEVLTLVLLSPGQEWSLTSLASRTGASVSSVQREITRAEQAGVVGSRRLGNTRLVKAADSPLTAPLTELLLRSFGPRQVLAEELEGVEGIEKAYLFGSWAARYAGEPGRPPADLDVLVIGNPDRDELDDAAQRAAGRLAREVSVTIRSSAWWRDGTDGFHADVTRRSLVPVFSEERTG